MFGFGEKLVLKNLKDFETWSVNKKDLYSQMLLMIDNLKWKWKLFNIILNFTTF